ncbi:MAG: hypothetical protein QGH33_17465, partial [Pirellulaceae bacterium]|nr:hypothetical protein [Pirellulaceae bacterium]
YYQGESCRVRRHTMRVDGFVSASADLKGGRLQTKPLVFAGTQLELNFSTSAAGSVRVEVQDTDGKPINGFSAANCPQLFGDSIARRVKWNSDADLSSLAGTPVRLLFELHDADLYSFQFVKSESP